jgi:hypothetical protein
MQTAKINTQRVIWFIDLPRVNCFGDSSPQHGQSNLVQQARAEQTVDVGSAFAAGNLASAAQRTKV